MKKLAGIAAFFALALISTSQPPPREQVGPVPGGFLLNNGWKIHPVGQQVALDTLPMSAVVSQNGQYMIVMNAGYKPPSLSVVIFQGGPQSASGVALHGIVPAGQIFGALWMDGRHSEVRYKSQASSSVGLGSPQIADTKRRISDGSPKTWFPTTLPPATC